MIFIIILVIAFVVYLFIKPYIIQHDTIVLYTGGNGSGKSLFSVRDTLRCLRRLRWKVRFHNFFERINPIKAIKVCLGKYEYDLFDKPVVYSTIPLRINRREWSRQLKVEHLMLQEKLPLHSVVFIDEINLLISQMDYKCKGEKALNEFVTLFRHYTRGFMILNTQNLSKVHWIFRYCCNEAINLSECKKIPFFYPLIFTSKVRKITLGDDIKSVETDDATDKPRVYMLRSLIKHYDTYCFGERYDTVPYDIYSEFSRYKTNDFRSIDCKIEYKPKTNGGI